jgi:hypothetical protein
VARLTARRALGALGVAAIVSLPAVAGASPNHATVCPGPIGPATVHGRLVVPAGADCELDSTVVIDGDVDVRPGGSLIATGARIRGSLTARGARFIALANCSEDDPECDQATVIGGRVLIDGTTDIPGFGINVICDRTKIGGSLTLEDNDAPFVVGDCTPDQSASVGNIIRGTLTVVGNTDQIIVTKNQISGSLICKRNDPTPLVDGNHVRGAVLGQCS